MRFIFFAFKSKDLLDLLACSNFLATQCWDNVFHKVVASSFPRTSKILVLYYVPCRSDVSTVCLENLSPVTRTTTARQGHDYIRDVHMFTCWYVSCAVQFVYRRVQTCTLYICAVQSVRIMFAPGCSPAFQSITSKSHQPSQPPIEER